MVNQKPEGTLKMTNHSRADSRPVHPRLGVRLFAAACLFLSLASACNRAPENPSAANDPDHLLTQMSEKLAQANKLSFRVDRKLDAALVEGRNIAETALIEISVSRPDKLLAKSNSKEDVRSIFFDGQNLSIYDGAMNLYATVSAQGTIDEVVAKVDEKYGFTPPLVEFILGDPYDALSRHIKDKSYQGKESIDGVECHRLRLSGEVADSELWIGTADLLPRKLVASFKNREGSPQLEASFSNWNLASSFDDTIFEFVAPKDAEKVEMITEAQMKEAAAKAEKQESPSK
jgi:hypothetical protein